MRNVLAALLVCLAASAQAQTGDPGPTFHALDDEAVRVITWYPDSYAITERAPDRRLRTRLFDRHSSEVLAAAEYESGQPGTPARLRADVDSEILTVRQSAPPRRPTAWSNAQLRELWLDVRARRAAGRHGVPALIADGAHWRIADAVKARPRRGGDEDGEIEAIATEFSDVMAVAQRDRHEPPERGERAARSTFTARMFDQTGREAGFVRWFAKERVLTWSFPNGRRGVAQESKVPGGFKFTPTLAWANVQALAFLRQSARPVPPKVPVPPSQGEPQPWAAMSVQDAPARGPMLAAAAGGQAGCDGIADGCTGLHFLDGTIFEECCTRHDLCYEREYLLGRCCEAWSWFFPNPFWSCARCNFEAVACFYTMASDPWDKLTEDVRNSLTGCVPRDLCERCNLAAWCDVECGVCRSRNDPEGRY